MNYIHVETIEELTAIVAGLQRESLAFHVEKRGDKWVVEITGF